MPVIETLDHLHSNRSGVELTLSEPRVDKGNVRTYDGLQLFVESLADEQRTDLSFPTTTNFLLVPCSQAAEPSRIRSGELGRSAVAVEVRASSKVVEMWVDMPPNLQAYLR